MFLVVPAAPAQIAPLLSGPERERFARQFRSSLSLEVFVAYWIPAARRVTVRSVNAQRRFRLAEGAVEIGVYAAPFPAPDFVDDLEALLHALGRARSLHEAPTAASAAPVAAGAGDGA